MSNIISGRLAKKCFLLGYRCSFNISTAQDIIPAHRAIAMSTEAIDVDGSSMSDNETVTLPGAVDAIAGSIFAVTVYGGDNTCLSEENALQSFLHDANVTAQLDNTFPLEVAAGEIIAKGSLIQVDAEGRAVAVGTATGMRAMEATTGVGTADNPEYVVVLINQLTA